MSEAKDYLTAAGETGSVSISEEVIAVVAGSVAAKIDGVASLHAAGGLDIAQITGRKALGRSVRVILEDGGVAVEVSVVAELGYPVAKVGEDVQRAVSDAIAGTCGVTPEYVDVKIVGVKTH